MNIPPSRARRQLAARLALHSKQNAESANSNGDRIEEAEHQKNLNPFATDEDDDSDADDGDFTIGDLENDNDDDGKGLLGSNKEEQAADQQDAKKNVGIFYNQNTVPHALLLPLAPVPSPVSLGIGRASPFPSLWPFGRGGNASFPDAAGHFRGSANPDDVQSDDSDDSDEGYGDVGVDGAGERGSGQRRLSVTTEAKRRTSLEDDDEDDEVVHVKMAEAEVDAAKKEGEGEDGELVEIQHAEMQGVEGEGK